ncbi:unnamed protein product [Caenorhabditis auriculariae]|uniref:Chondroitin proteoglycan 4 domain-containing protein n=1 Tax=Caenorhabditis auriculariae TaxID=2777116 RepID=A0A8S1HRI8_9PELO|nr:unnamed protein product [Caenorhabditis auriculariae]
MVVKLYMGLLLFGAALANPIMNASSTNLLTNTLETLKKSEGKIDMANLLKSFDAPTCMRRCMPPLDGLGNLLSGKKDERMVRNLCNKLQNSTRCATLAGCSHVFMDVVTNAFQFMCIENIDKIGENLECLKNESDDLQQICEVECGIQANVIEKASKKNEVKELFNVQNLCNSTACLVRCFKERMQGKCKIGEKNMVDTILSSVIRGEGRGFEQVMGWIMPDGCKDENLKLIMPERQPIDTSRPLNVGTPRTPSSSTTTSEVYNDVVPSPDDENNSTQPVETALLIDGEIRTLQCRMMDWDRNPVQTPDFESLARIMSAQLLPFSFPVDDQKNNGTRRPISVAPSLRDPEGAEEDDLATWRGSQADQVIPRQSSVQLLSAFTALLPLFFRP